MNNTVRDFYEAAGIGTINILIDRETVESGNAATFVHERIARCMADQQSLVTFRERLDFNWHGYDRDPRELFEIPEVVEFVEDLHARWPYALYFLTREGYGLQIMQACLAHARIDRGGKNGVAQIQLDQDAMSRLLTEQWLPAMAQMCLKAGYGDQAVEVMTDSAVAYLYKRQRTPSIGVGEATSGSAKPFTLGVGNDIWRSGEAYDLAEALEAQTLSSPEKMRSFRAGLELSWRGMADGECLWEVPSAVEFALDLDRRWPYAFFFLSRDGYALRDLACCVLASGTPIGNHAAEVWLPALASACETAGLDQDDFQSMADSALDYLRKHLTSNPSAPGQQDDQLERVDDSVPEHSDGRLFSFGDDDDIEVLDDTDVDVYADVEEEGDFGDLLQVARTLFGVWYDGSEIEWAAYMWSILERAGLTKYEDEVERTVVVGRLIALAGISREFASRAWSEGDSGEWLCAVQGAVLEGEYPLLDRVAVGRLAEKKGLLASNDCTGRESVPGLMIEVAKHEWSAVASALSADLGESLLFASLWKTPDGEARYPLPGEVLNEILNNPDEAMYAPFNWVQNGCDWRD